MANLTELYQRYIATVASLTDSASAASVDSVERHIDVIGDVGALSYLLNLYVNEVDGFRLELADQCFNLSTVLRSSVRWAEDNDDDFMVDELDLLSKLAVAILLAHRQQPTG